MTGTLSEFSAYHGPALELDEVKHGLILSLIARAVDDRSLVVSYWTLGGPGACAIRLNHRAIVLGALDEAECGNLAEQTLDTDYPGVVGPDLTAQWFTDRARNLGVEFLEPVPERIYAITGPPKFPGTSGVARTVTIEDSTLLAEWMTQFHREAIPREPAPSHAEAVRAAGEKRFLFWIDNGRPVSMATTIRRLKTSAAISYVYTPAEFRGRGYAGSVTAAMVERIQAEGRSTACLYADLGNPASNRCYTKIGFRPVCGSSHFHRRDPVILRNR
jgi:RimJ/RimL family protein N-acetyltransferase